MPTRRPTPARRRLALLAAALAVLALPAAALPPAAAGAGAAPGGDERQWVDRPDRVELREGERDPTVSAQHCRDPGRGDRVALERWLDDRWQRAGLHFLGPQRCETVVWQFGTIARALAGPYRFVTLQGATELDAVRFSLLVRLDEPTIYQQPFGGRVALGGRLTLRSAASGVGQVPRTQWESSTDGGQTWTPVPGATATAYQTPPAEAEMDGTRYRAVHTRPGMGQYETGGVSVSHAATLTVRQAPTITAEPAPAAVRVGATAVFEATAVGAPVPTVAWESAPPGEGWAPVPGADAARLEVPDVTAAMDGTRFRAVYRNSEGTRQTAEVRLTVLLPPEVFRHPDDVVAVPGQPVTFLASASPVVPELTRWQTLAPGADPVTGWVDLPGSGWFSYSVTARVELDGTRYRAVFGGEHGESVTDPALLTVRVVPPVRVAIGARVQPVAALPGG